MGIRRINLEPILLRVVLLLSGIALITLLLFSSVILFGDAMAGNADTIEVAELAQTLSPNNPTAYRASSQIREESFRDEDLRVALKEARTAAFLSPRNHNLWRSVARLTERTGDIAGAEKALKAALDLAPNNASLQWAYGNVLLRQDKFDPAFSYLQKAVKGDPKFAGPAASIAWDIFDGDVRKTQNAVGDSNPVKAALAGYLAKQERYDEAALIWESIPLKLRKQEYSKEGSRIITTMRRGLKFRPAVRIAASQAENEGAQPKVGKVTNRGFEFEIQQSSKSVFNWSIEKGELPTIGTAPNVKRSGKNSLALVFEGGPKKEFRKVSQILAVEPSKTYRLTAYYRSRLKGDYTLTWSVRHPAGRRIAESDPIELTEEWTALSLEFTSPEDVDGVELYLTPQSCPSSVCPRTGIVWFDDFELEEIQQSE